MADINETVYKVKYEPDKESLRGLGEAAKGTIEKSLGKAKPNVDLKLNTKHIEKAASEVDKLYDRFRSMPNATAAMEKSLGKAFDRVAKLQEQLEKGALNPKKFQDLANKNLNYVNNMINKSEKMTKGLNFFGENPQEKINRYLQSGLIKAPPIKIDDVDVSGAESKLMTAFSKLGQLAASKFLIDFAKNILGKIGEVGSKLLDQQIQLGGMLGSSEAAEATFNFLSDLAAKVPGDVSDMITAYNALVNRGIYPTEEAMKNLTTFATSQGQDVARLSEAITSAQQGQFVRLKAFGVGVQKNGNKLIVSFRGQKKEIQNTSQAITDYVASLGGLPGMAEAAEKRMNTLVGAQDKFRDSMNLIKFEIYKRLDAVLEPLFAKFNNIVDAIQKWVEKNPELATAITVVVAGTMALVGAIGLVTAAIAVLNTVSAPWLAIIAVIAAAIGALVFIVWDLWSGLTTGDSYILAAIDSFLEWAGVSYTVQDAIDWITKTLDDMISFFQNTVLPVWEAVWDALAVVAGYVMDWLGGYIGAAIDFWVGLFTGNIPKAKQGFTNLAKGIGAVFARIGQAAAKLVAYIIRIFANMWAKLAEKTKGIPIIGDMFAGASGIGNSWADSIEGYSDDLGSFADDNSFATQGAQNRSNASGKDRFRMPGGGDKEKKSGLVDREGGPGGGNTGGGKGKNAGKKAGSGEDKDAVDKATIVAIEGIEDILKKMGYSLTKEIERADLFGAQKKAITEMLTSKDKTGVMDVFNTMRSGLAGNTTNNNSSQRVNINMPNGQRVDSNKLQIKSSSTLNDIWNVGAKVNGG